MGTYISTGPSYHRSAYDPATAQKIVAWAGPLLKEHQIDAIAASGSSGLVIAGAVGVSAGIPVLAVRNWRTETEKRYGGLVTGVVPNGPAQRWAFIDDLIESGRTLDHVRNVVHANDLTTTNVPSLILLYDRYYGSGDYYRDVQGKQVPAFIFQGRA